MKKHLLFNAMVLIGLTSMAGTNINIEPQGENFTNTARSRYVEPIMFMEQGIEFLIFPDGSFDFNPHLKNRSNINNRVYSNVKTNSRRSSVNTAQGRSGTLNVSYYGKTTVNGVIIEHDYNGMVKRVGNVIVEYDKTGRIKRLGSIKMNYDDGKLSKVGGLKVKYNRWDEIISTRGTVNEANGKYKYEPRYSNGQSSSNYKDYANHNDYYYYKQGSTIKKQKKVGR
ncbi:MAG: hypothetical protein WA749_05615 [Gelidibacter sp.]